MSNIVKVEAIALSDEEEEIHLFYEGDEEKEALSDEEEEIHLFYEGDEEKEADDDPQVIITDDVENNHLDHGRSMDSLPSSYTGGSSNPGLNGPPSFEPDWSIDEQEEKARLILQVLELQNTLDETSNNDDVTPCKSGENLRPTIAPAVRFPEEACVMVERLTKQQIHAYTNRVKVTVDRLSAPVIDAYRNNVSVSVERLSAPKSHAYTTPVSVNVERLINN